MGGVQGASCQEEGEGEKDDPSYNSKLEDGMSVECRRLSKMCRQNCIYLYLCVGVEDGQEAGECEGEEDLGEVEGEDPAGDVLHPRAGEAGHLPQALRDLQAAAPALDPLAELERGVELPQGLHHPRRRPFLGLALLGQAHRLEPCKNLHGQFC